MTRRAFFAMAALLLVSQSASGQSSAEVNAGIQFNFASPGARSLARGGAFIADASDATAAYANPAGLVNLPHRELSLEARGSRYVNAFSDRGHAFGEPSGCGVDTIAGIQEGRATNRVTNVSFASVVFPMDGFTLAVYRHELARFAASARTQGVFFDDRKTNAPDPLRQYPAVSSLDLDITAIGLALAWRVGARLSLGAGIRRSESSLESLTQRFDTFGLYGPPNYDRLNNEQTQRGEGTSLGVNAGFLFDVNRMLSIGGSYRQGLSFPVKVIYVDAGLPDPTRTGKFNVPSFYGLGISIRPTDHWSIALDVNRITYSDITRGFVFLFTAEPRYFVPDGTEVRLGSEIVLTRDMVSWLPYPMSIAFGGWRDPDHSIRVSDPIDSQAVLFRPTAADYHVTFGLGMIVGTKAQFHAAVDRSTRQTVVSISAMARF